MKHHKLQTAETAGTYIVANPVTESDILEMARQLSTDRLAKGRSIENPSSVFTYLQSLLADYEYEVFGVLFLDTKHRVIRFDEMFRGTLESARVYPREVAKAALSLNAAAVILVHNHPSGDPEPSQTDRQLTDRIREALNLIEIRTLDHVVVGLDGCVSLAERGYL